MRHILKLTCKQHNQSGAARKYVLLRLPKYQKDRAACNISIYRN
ncbi:protein of unknown function [Maridesulfovibrio hydrothermalis AM13 = DSM 14728]|uniref:Uncharacterized protein n=1 Tax=Maridesulfovibrio hydrothermalis AM13 = DSM 14728 TaxID=1121451 RepID=L0RAM5_9BACT|nr:protein of unknown function [Maridesulfovibrio hydrothermalis AM13 = DSM 14728]